MRGLATPPSAAQLTASRSLPAPGNFPADPLVEARAAGGSLPPTERGESQASSEGGLHLCFFKKRLHLDIVN